MTALLLGILLLPGAPVPPADDIVAQFEDRSFTVPDAQPPRSVRYRLLKPSVVDKDKTYPVVLFLHGAGERGDDNRIQLLYLPEWMTQKEWRERYPCYLIAPQCPAGKWWTGATRASDTSGTSDPAASESELALKILRTLSAELPIDQRRVYLTGLSMGGYGSWSLAARHPELFAAVVPICGGGDPAWAGQLKDVPLWAVHGDADPVVPPRRSQEMIDALKTAGGSPRYSQLKDVKHDSWTPAYKDPHGVLEWMFEQHK
jgi:predicted peptidase